MNYKLTLLGALLGASLSLQAQPGAAGAGGAELPNRFLAGYSHSFETDFDDGGGEFSAYRAFVGAGTEWSLGRGASIGVELRYEYADYDFSGTSGFAALQPWDSINIFELVVPYQRPLGDKGFLSANVFVGFVAEDDGDWDDGLQVGGTLSYAYQFSPAFSLGIGGGGFYGLEDSTFYPFLFIRWQITESLVLANPFRPGPFGPAGLELAYQLDEEWEFGLGAVYRSFRFALDDDGVAPNGYGEIEGVPVFLRATWTFAPGAALDLYGGAVFAGQASLDNDNGDELIEEDFDTQPTAAAVVSWRF